MPWRLRPTARKRGRRTRYGDAGRLQALRQLRPRSAGAQLGAMPRVPQAQQMGAQTRAQVVAVAWSGSGPGGCPAGARPPQGGAPVRVVPPPRWSGGRNINRYARPWAPPAPSRPLRAPGPAAGPCPGAALPARRSGPRRLAGGGGPGCGALGPPPGPRGPSGGRLAYRRPACARRPGQLRAPRLPPLRRGRVRAVGGLASPPSSAPVVGVVGPGLRRPGPPRGGRPCASPPVPRAPPRPPGPPRSWPPKRPKGGPLARRGPLRGWARWAPRGSSSLGGGWGRPGAALESAAAPQLLGG